MTFGVDIPEARIAGRFRSLLPWITALFVVGCDSGFEPLPPVDSEVLVTATLVAPDRALLGEINVTANCEVTVGGIRNQPDRFAVALDGEPVASESQSQIDVTIALRVAGERVISAECTHDDETSRVERKVEAVEPVWLTVRLRNFTQDGEPFVRGEGPITFTVGDVAVTNGDSAAVPVFPNEEYEIFAYHPAFMRHWGRIGDAATGELVGFRHIWGQSSPVRVATSTSFEIFKMRTSDVTSIPNRVTDYWGDTGETYTLDDLRRIFPDRHNPYTGVLHPIIGDTLTIFVRGGEDELPTAMRNAINRLFRGYGFPHVSVLTGGAIQNVDIISGELSPPIRPRIDIQVGTQNSHTEFVTPEGVLSRSSVTVMAGSQSAEALTLLLHALGLRGDLGYDSTDDFVGRDGNPSELARLALKILYASPPNTRF